MGSRVANRKALVERFHGMEEVKGSIPFSSTPKPLLDGGFVASGGEPGLVLVGVLVVVLAS